MTHGLANVLCWRKTKHAPQIEQRTNFERQETGNGSLRLTVPAGGTGRGSSGDDSGRRAFRKRLLELDEAMLEDRGVPPANSLSGIATAKKVSGDIAKRSRSRWGDARRRKGRARGGGIDEEQDPRADWNEIPFSWIVRGRQERHLIDQQVRSPALPFARN